MQRLISIEIALYKLAMPEMEINIYGESDQKVYYNPIRIFALVNKEDTLMNDDMLMNVSQNVTFSFLRDDLKDLNLVVEEGDIIQFDAKYYEIDNTSTTQYWMGRNHETFLLNSNQQEHGYNIAISCKTHQTRISQLNLTEIRSGRNEITFNNLPRNL